MINRHYTRISRHYRRNIEESIDAFPTGGAASPGRLHESYRHGDELEITAKSNNGLGRCQTSILFNLGPPAVRATFVEAVVESPRPVVIREYQGDLDELSVFELRTLAACVRKAAKEISRSAA